MDRPQDSRPSVFREAHLRDYWKIVWQGRWTVLALFALVAGATTMWTFVQTPIYSATSIVEIQPKARSLLTAGQDVSGLGAAGYGWFAEEKYHNTQIEIIKSRDVAKRVVRLLDLAGHPAFARVDDTVEAFRSMVKVDPRRDTGLLEISLQGTNPDEITQWANAVAQAFVERNFERANENVEIAMGTIRAQIKTLEEDLQDAEGERIKTLESSEIFDSEGQSEIMRQNLQKWNAEVSTLELENKRLEDALQQVVELRSRNVDLLALPRFSSDESLRELQSKRDELERELKGLSATVRASHPLYKDRAAALASAEQRLHERITNIVEGLEKERDTAISKMKFLLERIDTASNASLQLAKATSKYNIVKTDAETKGRVFDMIMKTLSEVQLSAQLMTNNVTVLDEATPPRFPIKPRKRLNVAIGSMLGLFVGLAAVFFLEYLDNTIRTPEDVEKYLGLSVLAVVPKMGDQGLGTRAVREAYQSLRTSVIFSSKNRQRKVMLVTSTGPQEGKSSTLANLGRALAAAGDRVVILDCDMRRPTQQVHHQIEREPGLTNYLAAPDDDRDWSRYTKIVSPPTLQVLTCGPLPPNPPELLGNDRFRDLLAALRERYDWVLIDSPPAATLADAAQLAALVDMVVLVVQHNRTDRDLVIKTLQQLRAVNPVIAGVVLNNVDIERTYHKDYYYAGYYYYSEDEQKGRKKRVERKAQAG